MIVVTGATGNVGRPLVQALAVAGEKVTAVSRRPASDLPAGVVHVEADLMHPATLEPALDGADALFLLTSGEWDAGGGDMAAVLDVVQARGVRRVVLLSSQGVATGRHPSDLEDALTGSGVDWTVLRPGGFASNDLWWAEAVRDRRTVFTPFPDVGLPVIDPADIADVAAAVLLGDGHVGQVYELSGPVPIAPRRRVAAIGAALGEEVRLVEQTRAEAKAQMLRFMPERVADTTLDIFGEATPADQRVSPDVERVLGRPPRAYAEWVGRNITAFRD
ncbi:NAD(P)H-binding protein [Pseudonocardia sp. DSM 110487]|uniref:NAD(P)H-binding protein n=1 Tax=Pseudonocardia sp. DSM 110487 TaxID=2865833 RepID=UPI001C69936D|nr:NAD(P)H-binding protein [Pseudonocardia sp. DSM 110487]QYN34612.1 NAD(P)H-binding protein [Pseudonocardia sp. DSM 110487]